MEFWSKITQNPWKSLDKKTGGPESGSNLGGGQFFYKTSSCNSGRGFSGKFKANHYVTLAGQSYIGMCLMNFPGKSGPELHSVLPYKFPNFCRLACGSPIIFHNVLLQFFSLINILLDSCFSLFVYYFTCYFFFFVAVRFLLERNVYITTVVFSFTVPAAARLIHTDSLYNVIIQRTNDRALALGRHVLRRVDLKTYT